MRTFLKVLAAVAVMFLFVIFIEQKLYAIYGYDAPNPMTAIFRIYNIAE